MQNYINDPDQSDLYFHRLQGYFTNGISHNETLQKAYFSIKQLEKTRQKTEYKKAH